MELEGLLPLVTGTPAYRRLLARVQSPEAVDAVVIDTARPYLLAALHHSLERPTLVVAARPEDAKRLHEQLTAWTDALRFPEPDGLPYERIASDVSAETERVRALSTLVFERDEAAPPLLVASAVALMGKLPRRADFAADIHQVKLGMEIDPFRLLARWEALGYRMESTVEAPGAMSHRGGIIDIYSPAGELPARIEFFGNTVDSIRLFDPASQRSVRKVPSIVVVPATEVLAPFRDRHLDSARYRPGVEKVLSGLDLSRCSEETRRQIEQDVAVMLDGGRPHYLQFYAPLFNDGSLLDYLPPNGLLALDEPANIQRVVDELDAEAEQARTEKLSRGELPPDYPRPYFNWGELWPRLEERRGLSMLAWGEESLCLGFNAVPGYAGHLPSFLGKVKQLFGQDRRVIVVSHQASRLSELLSDEDILAAPVSKVEQVAPPGSVTLVQGTLGGGWSMGRETYLFTDAEIFGFVKQRRQVKRLPVSHHRLLAHIAPGDYVVHVEHGIARFAGVHTMGSNGAAREYLVLQYAAGDKLYVPVDQIDRVSRYVGSGDHTPAPSRLGTQEWARAKQRTKEAAEALARDLMSLYASREVAPGHAFPPDTVWQQEVEASFPYVETPDQMRAQLDVKADMEKPRPMDRLVCGDVGYGKTEVAVRAAFKSVMDGKQVAVLVPTTVLAEQHFKTFRQRLEAFPVRVQVLSRFKSPKEQRAVLDGLAAGSVDICIGTHRLLQKDVVFKDLGLVIVDEEQRFGVVHKEHLKKLRQEVDVLTLSATPIPRTLHMSLAGVRDMSVMETPPEERLPVKTYVAEYNERLIREAILRELERDGQVFFVHNRVQSIVPVASQLQALVPEARIAVAHGQMPEDDLEAVMAEFSQGQVDVLVCTTIIESGLDMPTVNTLIINQADKMGLTQLYQLRGRVGRGIERAYAYFLHEPGKRLTPTAEKRLQTIYEATELGAGFNIAMKDLEIRGAGTLLGARQSGHISAVGFDLYCRLLAEAVEQEKDRRAGQPHRPRFPAASVDLPLSAYIPADYVSEVETGLDFYRKLAEVREPGQIDDLAREMQDRFGPPPAEVENLLYVVRVRALASKAAVEAISTRDGQVIIRRFQGMPFDPARLGRLADGIKVGNTLIGLNIKRLGSTWPKVLQEVLGRAGAPETSGAEVVSRKTI